MIEAEVEARKQLGIQGSTINGISLEETRYLVKCKIGPDKDGNFVN